MPRIAEGHKFDIRPTVRLIRVISDSNSGTASIDAHLTIVFAVLAGSQLLDRNPDMPDGQEIHPQRRNRTIEIHASTHTLVSVARISPAADNPHPSAGPLSDDLRDALDLHLPRLRCAIVWAMSGAGRYRILYEIIEDAIVVWHIARGTGN